MLPLETVDRYMVACMIVGVFYMSFMLVILLCFLKMYHWPDGCGGGPGSGSAGPRSCQDPRGSHHLYSQVDMVSMDSVTRTYVSESYQMVPYRVDRLDRCYGEMERLANL